MNGNGIDPQQDPEASPQYYPPEPNSGEPSQSSRLGQWWDDNKIYSIIITVFVLFVALAIWFEHGSTATPGTTTTMSETEPTIDILDRSIVVSYNVADGPNASAKHDHERLNEAMKVFQDYLVQHPEIAPRAQWAPQHEFHQVGQHFDTTDRLIYTLTPPCGCSN